MGAIEIIGLVGHVGRDCISLAVDQILRIVTVLKLRNVIEGNAFPLEISQQFVGLRLQHDALADEVVNSMSVVVLLPRYQHVGRMLENNGQCYYWLTGISLQQQGARAYAEFCLALKDGFDRIAPRESFVNAYIKPRFAVVTQFFRCVVTGELEGMCPDRK